MMHITYTPIGIIHTPFKKPHGTPIQPTAGKGIEGRITIFPEYIDGLKDLDGFSHICLLFHFHQTSSIRLQTRPYLDTQERGIFSIRGPTRPNPIGLSIVRLLDIDKNILTIQDIDIIDGTPLLDIKPYIPYIDERRDVRLGWLQGKQHHFPHTTDDGRFLE